MVVISLLYIRLIGSHSFNRPLEKRESTNNHDGKGDIGLVKCAHDKYYGAYSNIDSGYPVAFSCHRIITQHGIIMHNMLWILRRAWLSYRKQMCIRVIINVYTILINRALLIPPVSYINHSLSRCGLAHNWFPWCCAQETHNFCKTFVQCWTNDEDVGPPLCKCYTNGLCLLGAHINHG